MFTGLVEEVGMIVSSEVRGKGRRIRIKAQSIMSDLAIDDSVSVNGACQTVVTIHNNEFEIDSVEETLLKTTLGSFSKGDAVNLERAMAVGDRLGGHIVQGHVDCVGRVDKIITVDGGGWQLWIAFPAQFAKYVVPVGSICINGVSLTVARVQGAMIMAAIIPHTLSVTTIGSLTVNEKVNIEFDILAKYVENMVSHTTNSSSSVYTDMLNQPNL